MLAEQHCDLATCSMPHELGFGQSQSSTVKSWPCNSDSAFRQAVTTKKGTKVIRHAININSSIAARTKCVYAPPPLRTHRYPRALTPCRRKFLSSVGFHMPAMRMRVHCFRVAAAQGPPRPRVLAVQALQRFWMLGLAVNSYNACKSL